MTGGVGPRPSVPVSNSFPADQVGPCGISGSTSLAAYAEVGHSSRETPVEPTGPRAKVQWLLSAVAIGEFVIPWVESRPKSGRVRKAIGSGVGEI